MMRITFTPGTLHTFATNRFPRFRDTSDGLWRRVLLIPFNWQVPAEQRDLQLARRLVDQELPGILNWTIEGWQRLHRQQQFTRAVACEDLLAEQRRLSSNVASFVHERCQVSPDLAVERQVLYQAYSQWCEVVGRRAISQANFGKELENLVPGLRTVRPMGQDGTRHRLYQGINLPTSAGFAPPAAPDAVEAPAGRASTWNRHR